MEKIILISFGILALLILVQKTKKIIKGLTQNEPTNDCGACGNCCKSGCEPKE